MPESTRQVFINVFSRLKQGVIWKWDEDIPGLPPHIMVRKWLPQQDILGLVILVVAFTESVATVIKTYH